jgi:hypothetical protein
MIPLHLFTSSSLNDILLVIAELESDTCSDAMSSVVDEAMKANMLTESLAKSAEDAQSFSGMILNLDSVTVNT